MLYTQSFCSLKQPPKSTCSHFKLDSKTKRSKSEVMERQWSFPGKVNNIPHTEKALYQKKKKQQKTNSFWLLQKGFLFSFPDQVLTNFLFRISPLHFYPIIICLAPHSSSNISAIFLLLKIALYPGEKFISFILILSSLLWLDLVLKNNFRLS